eukprot:CAMPEP_0172812720 /NCGR_PEP_ID=MMETSP1075-20121228/10204_1 /TAXON_ID=2916 /ORGANISM="Ceratium fusus, Strain PA161109" /LENGTH=358 /DNA_ID=CAMNT_0013652305 /DNA_START=61 /DNA_END=1139 /DNA_ORIENTATION=-
MKQPKQQEAPGSNKKSQLAAERFFFMIAILAACAANAFRHAQNASTSRSGVCACIGVVAGDGDGHHSVPPIRCSAGPQCRMPRSVKGRFPAASAAAASDSGRLRGTGMVGGMSAGPPDMIVGPKRLSSRRTRCNVTVSPGRVSQPASLGQMLHSPQCDPVELCAAAAARIAAVIGTQLHLECLHPVSNASDPGPRRALPPAVHYPLEHCQAQKAAHDGDPLLAVLEGPIGVAAAGLGRCPCQSIYAFQREYLELTVQCQCMKVPNTWQAFAWWLLSIRPLWHHQQTPPTLGIAFAMARKALVPSTSPRKSGSWDPPFFAPAEDASCVDSQIYNQQPHDKTPQPDGPPHEGLNGNGVAP